MRWVRATTALVAIGAALLSASNATAATQCSARWRLVAETAGPWLNGGLVALGPTDVWASGRVGPTGDPTPVLVHWDGRHLRRFAAFTPTREGGGTVGALSAVSSTDVWALGRDGIPWARSNNNVNTSVVLHWNGREWSRMPTPPLPKGAVLDDIAAAGPNDVWLVGEGGPYFRPIILHWNGTRWGVSDLWRVTPYGSMLSAIASRSPDDVWAVGTSGLDAPVSFGYGDLVMHWDGRHWAQVHSPLGDVAGSGPFPFGVGIAPSGEVWTVNQDESANDPAFVRFSADGTHASVLTPGIDFGPNQIVPVSSESLWVTGVVYGSNGLTGSSALLHRDGGRWRFVHIPKGDMKQEPFWTLAALSPSDVWAAGGRLLARWSC